MVSIALACFLASAAPNDEDDGPKNEWSPRVRAVLQKPDRIELLSLGAAEPFPEAIDGRRVPKPGQRFHGVDVLGRAKLDAAAWKPLLAVLDQGLPQPKADPNPPAKPFGNGFAAPEVVAEREEAFGVRLVRGDDVVGLNVQPNAVAVWLNDEEKVQLTLHRNPLKAFRAAARAAKLPPADLDPIPAAYRDVLEKADTLELLSLNHFPDAGAKKLFHGNEILGRTALTKDQRGKVLAALADATKKPGLGGAGCFIPRHGLRATHDGVTVGLVICLECGKIDMYYGESDTYHTKLR